MRTRESITVATRGSALARSQAETVVSRLADHRVEATLVEVETTGDRVDDALIQDLGRTGAFVRALDERVLDGAVDAAVHSMKDLPTDQPEGLVVAAVPKRASVVDALVTPDGIGLEDLPTGATVGTSSLRRAAQVLARRPDLDVEPLRGNVDTRVEKLLAPHLRAERDRRLAAEAGESDDGDASFERSPEEWLADRTELERAALEREVDVEYDAIVLARAGLDRSGLADQVRLTDLPKRTHVPSAGQGALAITAREGGDVAELLFSALDHPHSRVATTVERILLAELGAGCIAPVGIAATIKGDAVEASVQVLSRDGSRTVAATRQLDVERYADAARAFAADLAGEGATELIEEAKRE